MKEAGTYGLVNASAVSSRIEMHMQGSRMHYTAMQIMYCIISISCSFILHIRCVVISPPKSRSHLETNLIPDLVHRATVQLTCIRIVTDHAYARRPESRQGNHISTRRTLIQSIYTVSFARRRIIASPHHRNMAHGRNRVRSVQCARHHAHTDRCVPVHQARRDISLAKTSAPPVARRP